MLEHLCIVGGRRLTGEVRVSGAKNAALPLLISTLLTAEPVTLSNIPDLEDITVLLRLLRSCGAEHRYDDGTVQICAPSITCSEAPYSLVKLLRASFWVLGPLLARAGEASVALPGGDAIGTRPVDLHLEGLAQLGADIRMSHGVVHATAPGGLRPAEIKLGFPSVGATHHLLMTAALVPGVSVLHGAAREPEIVAVADLLNKMGASIEGAGTDTLRIEGRSELGGAVHEVIGDRIEAATYLLGAAMTQGQIKVSGINPATLRSTLQILEQAGCVMAFDDRSIALNSARRLRAVSFATEPFPGVATDVQPVVMAALCTADGVSSIRETVFESRFGHVAQYRRFGANIVIDDRTATITGVEQLSAAPVEGLDIRAAAGMVLIGLVADGVTQVSDIYHLDRGYAGLVQKFSNLGADVSRLPAVDAREVVHGC